MCDKQDYSVFYLPESVFNKAGQELMASKYKDAFNLLFKSTLLNIRYRKIIGTHLTFTTKQIMGLVKSNEYANKFIGILKIGSNMAFPEDDDLIRGDKNVKLLQCAIDRDGEITGKVNIVTDDILTKKYFENAIKLDDYPLFVVSIKQALKEMEEIEKKLSKLPFKNCINED